MKPANQNTTTMSRRNFLRTSAATALGCKLFGLATRFSTFADIHQNHSGDHPATHGMVVVGEKTVFLSHLPLFKSPKYDSPHDYQVILEATFKQKNAKPQQTYFSDRKQSGTKLYTLEPEKFVLPCLALATGGQPQIHSFQGSIYRGHFERGGLQILREVTVDITRVVHFRKFDPEMKNPKQLEYLLFGKGNELFLAHFITRPPDFDHLISVTLDKHHFSDEILGKGVLVTIPNRANSASERLTERQQSPVRLRGFGKPDSQNVTARITVGTEFYFEAEELSS